jgi:hypothetical protein
MSPQYSNHTPLLARPYFTLPRELLQQLTAKVGEDRFDAELLKMEYNLSGKCRDHSSCIGFWRGHGINFQLLRPASDLTDDFFIQGMAQFGKTASDAKDILALGQQRLEWTSDVRRGYAGWLMTNKSFLDEHQTLFQQWADEVAKQGIPNMGPVLHDAQSFPDAELAEGTFREFLRAFEEFFIRWRLDGLPAPFAPQPMGVQLPVVDLRPVLGHMQQGGTTFYIPDICPVPSRDKLREIMEEALRDQNSPAHLKEWLEIVHSDNVAKNQIPRYGRILEIQHYMRALYARHAAALERKKSAVVVVISLFLQVSDDTVERDLAFIAERLGANWHLPTA